MRALALTLALLAVPALADEKVKAQADVVFASTKPGSVDPSLASMQTALSSRVKYTTLKKVGAQALTLGKAPALVSLPNGKNAELTLVTLKDNVAQVHVKVTPLDATYSLGKDHSLFVDAGEHQDGKLWLVLSQPK